MFNSHNSQATSWEHPITKLRYKVDHGMLWTRTTWYGARPLIIFLDFELVKSSKAIWQCRQYIACFTDLPRLVHFW